MTAKTLHGGRVAKKNLLLPEMIISIFFFALAAAGCVKLFAEAYADGNYSRNLTAAVVEAQNAAECFKAANGDVIKTAELYGTPHDVGEEQLTFFFNENWEKISGLPEYGFFLWLQYESSQTDDFVYAVIKVYQCECLSDSVDALILYSENEALYELKVVAARGAGL